MRKIFGLIFISVILFSSCSRKKNTALSRAYHNTTSRYNGYFNAREIIKASEKKLKEEHKDDYSTVLPIYIYPTEKQSQSMYKDMDVVIEKCSEVIERHSIRKRKKEAVKWIDDSYYLIAKARFYKQEYSLAEETFLYVYQAYKKDPNRYAGLNGLIRTYIETEEWDKAEEFLDLAVEDKKVPEEHKAELYGLYADFHLKRDQDYEKAIENLEEALKFIKKKKDRTRPTFILAQLYHKQEEATKATDLYANVLKLRPDYTMRFNAKINRAIAFDVSKDSESIKKELRKMLKDKKNTEFKDQIYFALAELVLKEGDEPLAIDYFKKSARYSISNNKQKALAYFKLAELYFKKPHYINAQAYYDSTLQFLPKEHPDYFEADDKNNNLQDLVKNLKIIELQDSLLSVSKLSEKEKEKLVKSIIEETKAEEERKKQAEMRALEMEQQQNTQTNTAGRSKGQWYFYNQNTTVLGMQEFRRIWGNRLLENNWRRKNKSSAAIVDNEKPKSQEEVEQQKVDSAANAQKYNPEFYLKNIPSSPKEELLAHGKIAEALFNVGTIFKESFNDFPNSINSFKRINKEYDTSRHNLPSHYQLYRIYTLEEEKELAEAEQQWILDNHPFSEYAYLIKNPNYAKESKETREKVEQFYEATYKLFSYKLYADVISSCEKADRTFSKNHLKPQFDFLKAKSIGHTSTKEAFKKALEEVVTNHSEDPVKDKAQYIIDFMNKPIGETTTTKKTNFIYDQSEKHFFVLSLDKENKNSNQLKIRLSDFNKGFFREKNLQITNTILQKRKLLMVRAFNNKKEAVRYLKAFRNNTPIRVVSTRAEATEYLISINNFRTLFKSKNEEEYLQFFRKNYKL